MQRHISFLFWSKSQHTGQRGRCLRQMEGRRAEDPAKQLAVSDAFTDKKEVRVNRRLAMVLAIPWEVFVTFQVFFWVPSSNPSLSLLYFSGWVRSGALCSTFSSKQEFWAAGILLFCSLPISPLNVRNHSNRNSLNSTIGMGKRNFLLKQRMMQSWVFITLTHSNLTQRKHLSGILCCLVFPWQTFL